jgi:CheY-like chemotaxis protein
MTSTANGAFSGLRVLVVEDETVVAMLIEDMLAELGCTVVGTASRLSKALQLLERVEADIAVLDVNLAGEEVYPVAEMLASQNLPFVFATGYGSGGVREAWRDRPTLEKPFQRPQIRRVLSEAIAASSENIG